MENGAGSRLVFVGQDTTSEKRTLEEEKEKFVKKGQAGSGRSDSTHTRSWLFCLTAISFIVEMIAFPISVWDRTDMESGLALIS